MLKQTQKRTKIIVTLGPSTDQNNNIEKIILSGINAVRLNFSHGNIEEHCLRINTVRNISHHLNQKIAILGDLQGPKIRIAKFKQGKIFLNIRDTFILDASLDDNNGNQNQVGLDYKNLFYDVKIGDILLLDDGRIQLKVIKIQDMKIYTEVMIGGYLSDKKGINKLGGGLSAPTLTEKDKNDIIFAAKIGVDYLAISFPRNKHDIHYARYLMNETGSHAKIIAKIERAEAVSSNKILNDIIRASDAIMIARGDLGVEIGDAQLAGIQKKIIHKAHILNRAVITATQMMESMINNPIPTRAEVMDIANAVLDGTDAVMLSSETATGKFPVETVRSMIDICIGAERIPSALSTKQFNLKSHHIEEIIAMSTMYAANSTRDICAIIIIATSNCIALSISRIHSNIPIFFLSKDEHILNITSLYRSIIPIYFNSKDTGTKLALLAIKFLRNLNLLTLNSFVIVIQHDDMNTQETTNSSCILCVK